MQLRKVRPQNFKTQQRDSKFGSPNVHYLGASSKAFFIFACCDHLNWFILFDLLDLLVCLFLFHPEGLWRPEGTFPRQMRPRAGTASILWLGQTRRRFLHLGNLTGQPTCPKGLGSVIPPGPAPLVDVRVYRRRRKPRLLLVSCLFTELRVLQKSIDVMFMNFVLHKLIVVPNCFSLGIELKLDSQITVVVLWILLPSPHLHPICW